MNLLRCCRGSVDNKTKSSMDRGSIKNLSRRQRARNFGSMDRISCLKAIEKKPRNLDGSRSCREAIKYTESKEIFLNGSRFLLKKRKKGSIERNPSRFYREAVELEENEFFKEEKHIKMNATSKLLNQRSNQHVKLSKHLSTYMQSIHRSRTKTHTHTHTCKTSLTNFIFQKQVRII